MESSYPVMERSVSNQEFDSPYPPTTTVPRHCYDYRPECCDGINNSGDDEGRREDTHHLFIQDRNRMKTILILSAIAICMASASAASETAYMPFPISGYVFHEDAHSCNNPNVTVTNINTNRTFPTMTLPSSNYYRLSLL